MARATNSLVSTIERAEEELRDTGQIPDMARLDLRLRYSDSLLAIITFWVKGEQPLVELTWWRARYRDARLLALALFRLEYGSGDISIAPDFRRASGRFDTNESQDRNLEIKEVDTNFAKVKLRLEELISRVRKKVASAKKPGTGKD